MTVKGGTSQACAACKYQRRKCSADCMLAPYFPPDQPKMFQNAHRLFGVSNILKILKNLNPAQQDEAMRSIIAQSNIRERYPVEGCVGIIMQLQYEIQHKYMELEAITAQLQIYRNRHPQHIPSSPPPQTPQSPSTQLSQLHLGNPTPASPNNALSLFQHPYNVMGNGISMLPNNQPQGLGYANNNNNNAAAYNYVDSKDNVMNQQMWVQHPYNQNNNNNNNNSLAMPSQFGNAQQVMPLQQQQPLETTPDYDQMPAFFDSIDDRQSFIDSKEAYDSSPESSMKDTTRTMEHVSENELKSAAACFTLTSVN